MKKFFTPIKQIITILLTVSFCLNPTCSEALQPRSSFVVPSKTEITQKALSFLNAAQALKQNRTEETFAEYEKAFRTFFPILNHPTSSRRFEEVYVHSETFASLRKKFPQPKTLLRESLMAFSNGHYWRQYKNTSPFIVAMSDPNRLDNLKKQAEQDPNNASAQLAFCQEALRLGQIELATTAYLNYLCVMQGDAASKISISSLPFDFIDEVLRVGILENRFNLSQAQMLFAQLFRKLKANKESAWPQEGNLSKTKIYEHIFKDLLGNWRNLAFFGSTELREYNARWLSTFILIHMLGVEEITGFGKAEQNQFRISSYVIVPAQGLTVRLSGTNLSNVDLSGVNLSGANLSEANLTGTDLHGANLQNVNLERATLRNTDLCGADLSGAKLTWTKTHTEYDVIGTHSEPTGINADWYGTDYIEVNDTVEREVVEQGGADLKGAKIFHWQLSSFSREQRKQLQVEFEFLIPSDQIEQKVKEYDDEKPLFLSLSSIYKAIESGIFENKFTLAQVQTLFSVLFFEFEASFLPTEGALSKEKIYEYIFGSLFWNWEDLSLFGHPETREKNARWLLTGILIHMLKISGIVGFEDKEKKQFRESKESSPYEIAPLPLWLQGALLCNMDLRNAKLEGVNLSDSDLRDTKLFGANLKCASLQNADLRNMDLSGMNLYGIDLRGAKLEGVRLNGANCEKVDLRNTDLSNVDLYGANLSSANLEGVDLRGKDLNGMILRQTNLNNTNLEGLDLSGKNLRGMNFQEANLRGVNLSGAHLEDANLSHANLEGLDLSGTYLKDVKLQGVNLRGANLQNKNLSAMDLFGVNFERANLQGVDFRGGNLRDVNLRSANLQEVKMLGSSLSRRLYLHMVVLMEIYVAVSEFLGAMYFTLLPIFIWLLANKLGLKMGLDDFLAILVILIFNAMFARGFYNDLEKDRHVIPERSANLDNAKIFRSQLRKYRKQFSRKQIRQMQIIDDLLPPSLAIQSSL